MSAELGESSGRCFAASSAESVSAASPGLPGAITEGPVADADLVSSSEPVQPPSARTAAVTDAVIKRRDVRRESTATSCGT
jgi:hypothetical protein